MKKVFKKLLFIFCLFLLLLTLILLCSPFFIKYDDVLGKADAIVVLGGESGERVRDGVALYKKGYAPYMVLTGGLLAWGTNSSDIMKKQAISESVPEKVIFIESSAESTSDNAEFIIPILKRIKAKKIIVVTSAYHSKRAKMTFEHYMQPLGIKVIMRSALPNKYTRYNPNFWWTRHEDRQFVLSELFKYAYYKNILLFN